MKAKIEGLDYKRGVQPLGLSGLQKGMPGSNAPKVVLRLKVTEGFTRVIEQNIYWTLTNAAKGNKIDERFVANLAHELIGEEVEMKRDGGGSVYVSQDSLETLLLSKL